MFTSKNEPKKTSVVILAAGFSSRMKSPKPFLKYDSNTLFIEKIIQTYREFGCEEIIVVFNPQGFEYYQLNKLKFPENTKLVINDVPDSPRFISVKLGLKNNTSEYCFIQNVDNPFINIQTLQLLSENKDSSAYIVPVYDNKSGHPILLGADVINNISQLEGDDYILSEILKQQKRIQLTINEPNIHYNINSPDNYTKLGLPF